MKRCMKMVLCGQFFITCATEVSKNEQDGSVMISNKVGVYTTAPTRPVTIASVTLHPDVTKKDAAKAQDIKNNLMNKGIDDDTEISRAVIALQLNIDNKIYIVQLANIASGAHLELIDTGPGFSIRSAEDEKIKIQPIIVQFSKGQTQMLKLGIDIPDLPPNIFSIKGMQIPGLNPLSS